MRISGLLVSYRPLASRNYFSSDGVGRPKFAFTQAFATATVVGAIEGVCRDMLKSADVVPNLLLLFPPAPAATIPARKGE